MTKLYNNYWKLENVINKDMINDSMKNHTLADMLIFLVIKNQIKIIEPSTKNILEIISDTEKVKQKMYHLVKT